MTEELYIPHTARYCLFAIDFKVELLLYEVRDALFDTLSCSRSLAEDYTIISITHKRMSAFLQLLVQFVKNYIAEERAERTALRCAELTFLAVVLGYLYSADGIWFVTSFKD